MPEDWTRPSQLKIEEITPLCSVNLIKNNDNSSNCTKDAQLTKPGLTPLSTGKRIQTVKSPNSPSFITLNGNESKIFNSSTDKAITLDSKILNPCSSIHTELKNEQGKNFSNNDDTRSNRSLSPNTSKSFQILEYSSSESEYGNSDDEFIILDKNDESNLSDSRKSLEKENNKNDNQEDVNYSRKNEIAVEENNQEVGEINQEVKKCNDNEQEIKKVDAENNLAERESSQKAVINIDISKDNLAEDQDVIEIEDDSDNPKEINANENDKYSKLGNAETTNKDVVIIEENDNYKQNYVEIIEEDEKCKQKNADVPNYVNIQKNADVPNDADVQKNVDGQEDAVKNQEVKKEKMNKADNEEIINRENEEEEWNPNGFIVEKYSHITFYTTPDNFAKQIAGSRSENSSPASSRRSSVEEVSSQESTNKEENKSLPSKKKTRKRDMSPWATDSFFLKFPSYHEEERKKEEQLRYREECQKFLKEQKEKPVMKPHMRRKTKMYEEGDNKYENVSSNNQHNPEKSSPNKTDKTETEIIVNNPSNAGTSRNFNNNNGSDTNRGRRSRCPSAKEMVQQDLQHISVPAMLLTNACDEKDRRRTELQKQMKEEWLECLNQQIEEKKERKRIEEENKARWEADLERRMARDEQKMLQRMRTKTEGNTENGHNVNNEKNSADMVDGRVYNFFRNSAGYQGIEKYSRPNLQDDSDDSPQVNRNEKNIDNNNNNNDNKANMVMNPVEVIVRKVGDSPEVRILGGDRYHKVANEDRCQFCKNDVKQAEAISRRRETIDEFNMQARKDSNTTTASRFLCDNCNKMYSICVTCKDIYSSCSNCKRNHNICHHCVGNYCTNCGKSIRGEKITISSRSDAKSLNKDKYAYISNRNLINETLNKVNVEPSFKILEKINCAENSESDTKTKNKKYHGVGAVEYPLIPFSPQKCKLPGNSSAASKKKSSNPDTYRLEELCSRNMERYTKHLSRNCEEKIRIDELKIDNKAKMCDRFKRTTQDRVREYFENYGDIYKKSSSNKVSRAPRGRDDAPIIPFSNDLIQTRKRDRLSLPSANAFVRLRRKWEIPAVQKQTISDSDNILTQLGAFKKQLQEMKFNYKY